MSEVDPWVARFVDIIDRLQEAAGDYSAWDKSLGRDAVALIRELGADAAKFRDQQAIARLLEIGR